VPSMRNCLSDTAPLSTRQESLPPLFPPHFSSRRLAGLPFPRRTTLVIAPDTLVLSEKWDTAFLLGAQRPALLSPAPLGHGVFLEGRWSCSN